MAEQTGVPSRGVAIFGSVGLTVAGGLILGLSIWGDAAGFHGPRWVIGSLGGAFLVLGGWSAVCYSQGYDPRRPKETLPSARVQLIVGVPGILLFAAPFHWVALGSGPRHFSGGFSIPFLTIGHSAGAAWGRIVFGLSALMIDVFLVLWARSLVRRDRRERGADLGRLGRT
jgi:hypothetical protein